MLYRKLVHILLHIQMAYTLFMAVIRWVSYWKLHHKPAYWTGIIY